MSALYPRVLKGEIDFGDGPEESYHVECAVAEGERVHFIDKDEGVWKVWPVNTEYLTVDEARTFVREVKAAITAAEEFNRRDRRPAGTAGRVVQQLIGTTA